MQHTDRDHVDRDNTHNFTERNGDNDGRSWQDEANCFGCRSRLVLPRARRVDA